MFSGGDFDLRGHFLPFQRVEKYPKSLNVDFRKTKVWIIPGT